MPPPQLVENAIHYTEQAILKFMINIILKNLFLTMKFSIAGPAQFRQPVNEVLSVFLGSK
jgi:hypothetical protein